MLERVIVSFIMTIANTMGVKVQNVDFDAV